MSALQKHRPEPVFVTVFFIGLLALLGVLVSNTSSPTACSASRSSAGTNRPVNIQQASRAQRIALSER